MAPHRHRRAVSAWRCSTDGRASIARTDSAAALCWGALRCAGIDVSVRVDSSQGCGIRVAFRDKNLQSDTTSQRFCDRNAVKMGAVRTRFFELKTLLNLRVTQPKF